MARTVVEKELVRVAVRALRFNPTALHQVGVEVAIAVDIGECRAPRHDFRKQVAAVEPRPMLEDESPDLCLVLEPCGFGLDDGAALVETARQKAQPDRNGRGGKTRRYFAHKRRPVP